jgi:hypothetical protein
MILFCVFTCEPLVVLFRRHGLSLLHCILGGSIDSLSVNCRSNLRLCRVSKQLEVDVTGIGHWLFGELCGLIRLLVLCNTFFQLFVLLLIDEVLLSQGNLGMADEVWSLLIFMSSCSSCIIFLADCNSWVSSSRVHLYSTHDLHEDVWLGTLFPSTFTGCSRQHSSLSSH